MNKIYLMRHAESLFNIGTSNGKIQVYRDLFTPKAMSRNVTVFPN